mmetsp:Transcript_2266/g.3906  ORF Transcript_2266/g.3906 Transcript_2266/m.3906 type:complete len:190 (+) Transcript_2266:94-663(+)
MCFPSKDHRMNMLHSLLLLSLILSILTLAGGNVGAIFGVCLWIFLLFTDNKCCYLCMSVWGCVCGCSTFLVAVLFGLACFLPHEYKRGILDDESEYLSKLGIKGETLTFPNGTITTTHSSTVMHFVGITILLILCCHTGVQCGIGYYSNQVYHYPGDVEDLRHGPGVDGQGLVVGVHEEEAHLTKGGVY